ncbi:hypothetical protein CKG00_17710 [Morganella morganii]|uniref:Uncharacterized protein n=1 Tax=Morganella morganii TaxID=582 RepID=A0A433ZQ77_MORMO|nr:hypothetical protein CKG00_17710 [Morganella morganii]
MSLARPPPISALPVAIITPLLILNTSVRTGGHVCYSFCAYYSSINNLILSLSAQTGVFSG